MRNLLLTNFLNVLTTVLFLSWFVAYLLYATGSGWLIHGLFVLALASLGVRLWLARHLLAEGTGQPAGQEAH